MARCDLPYSLEIGKLAMYVKYLREMREMPPKEVLYTAIPGPFKFEDPTTFQAMTVQRYVGGDVQIVSLTLLNFGFFYFYGAYESHYSRTEQAVVSRKSKHSLPLCATPHQPNTY